MRRLLIGAAALALVGCAGGAPEPAVSSAPGDPSPTAAATDDGTPSEAPSPAPSPSEDPSSAAPAVAPTVEGEWREHDPAPLADDAAIGAAELPDGLKQALRDAVLDVVVMNEEYDDEFPDCPVEVSVGGIHPVGFAVASIAGCGPAEATGVFAYTDGAWHLAVPTSPEPPSCHALADAGVPAGVPYPWDGGQLHCIEGSEQRIW